MNSNDPFSLAGKTALITGSTQGIGAAIAKSLAKAGANVCLHGLAMDNAAQEVIQSCLAHGVEAKCVLADLASNQPESITRFCEDVDDVLPGIDLLINNAGTYCDIPFLEMTSERYSRTMRLNVDAGFFITQFFAKRWIESSVQGRVLFTGSINGFLAERNHVAYDASKGAVAAMVKSLCVALAPHGIRINSIAPGLIRTPLTDEVLSKDENTLRWMQLHTPSGVVPEADVCGPAAVFLLSDVAAHIHGQTLFIDGGMSVWQQPDFPESLRDSLFRD